MRTYTAVVVCEHVYGGKHTFGRVLYAYNWIWSVVLLSEKHTHTHTHTHIHTHTHTLNHTHTSAHTNAALR